MSDITYEKIEQMEVELGCKKHNWLISKGWKYDCNYVDSRWRWSKEIEGIMMTVSTEEAIKIERNFIDKFVDKKNR